MKFARRESQAEAKQPRQRSPESVLKLTSDGHTDIKRRRDGVPSREVITFTTMEGVARGFRAALCRRRLGGEKRKDRREVEGRGLRNSARSRFSGCK